jgi:hypothetical protein
MRKRLALLCFRVARWLAPLFFAKDGDSLAEIRLNIGVLRGYLESMPGKARRGAEGAHVAEQLRRLESKYKALIEYGAYELVKIEVAQPTIPNKIVPHNATSPQEHLRITAKEQLFAAVAKGLSQSAEIEKFMYFRVHGTVKTVGIRLYLKHND